jgi:hypothetical protein
MTPSNIPLTEVWDRYNWDFWSADLPQTTATSMGEGPAAAYPYSVSGQNHIDLVSFLADTGWTWTGGTLTFGYLPTTHWPGATFTVTPGNVELTWTPPAGADIDFNYIPGGSLVLTLPSFPLSAVDIFNSYIDLTSDGFDTQILSLPMDLSQSTLIEGNAYAIFTAAEIGDNPGITNVVNGVRIRFDIESNCTIDLAGLRLIDPNWIASNVDFDNANEILRSCIPIDGDPTYTPEPNQYMPVLYRSDAPSNINDPAPINGNVGVLLNTGSMSSANQFTLYVREQNVEYITQANLEGIPQYVLEGQDVQDLGLSEPLQVQNWQAFQIQWGLNNSISIYGSATSAQTYTFGLDGLLDNHTYYAILCEYTDNTARAQIYSVNSDTGLTESLVFDTQLIDDAFTFIRQSGRIGFQAQLLDGDTFIESIRPSQMTFAAYQSAPMTSITPVAAARLYASFSPDIVLWRDWLSFPDLNGSMPLLTTDPNNSQSIGVSVYTPSTETPAQGVISNVLTPFGDADTGITDFTNLNIDFSLYVPQGVSSTLDNLPVITAELVNANGGSLPLTLPASTPNAWQDISCSLPPGFNLSGLYTLRLHYNGNIPIQFYVANVVVTQRSVAWSARSVVSDAWSANYAPWTPFHELVNSDTEGVRFTTIGDQLQIQALALQQDAAIYGSIQTIPIYAQLGSFLFPDDPTRQPITSIVTVSYTWSATGLTVAFTGDAFSLTDGQNNAIPSYVWSFGDGTYGTGEVVSHTYDVAGSYYVVLTVTDVYGNTNYYTAPSTHPVTVT